MFTGIVEESGVVQAIKPTKSSIRLEVASTVCSRGVKLGESIAVNGCCLTVVKSKGTGKAKTLSFDLLRETWTVTNLQDCSPGSRVNLERALKFSDRIGGHFVTGHIDALGKIKRLEQSGSDTVLDITAPKSILNYVIYKGSIAVDGISLTVAKVMARSFRIWVIPHTLKVTSLGERTVGDRVNLEPDMLAKYVEKLSQQPR
jgi:riboflavin synthase